MSGFQFSQASEDLLRGLDPRLVQVMRKALERTPFDWRIVQTQRSIEQQRAYFAAGTSRINPDAYIGDLPRLYRDAKHVVGPGQLLARAVDVCLVGKDPYHIPSLCYLAGVVRCCAIELGVPVRWGGDFDRDGLLLEPGTFHDLPHFEIDNNP